MPLICYEPKAFSNERMDLITKANLIIDQYQQQGFALTLRQLYYQFIARDWFPSAWAKNGTKNNESSYTRLGDLVSDGRLAGLIDWYAIVDRGRGSHANQHWSRPSDIIKAASTTYATDKWENQPHYIEVWIEKEALQDVLARACQPLDVRFFACKGYTSQSAMWEAAQRLLVELDKGKEVHIIHLGDHDPSGIDMTRDIEDRLNLFTRSRVHVHRIALTMAQISQYNPPPNFAKQTDTRFRDYQQQYGNDSWELDALDPTVLVSLITKTVLVYRNEKLWEEAIKVQERGKYTIECLINYFPEVVKFLREIRLKDTSRVICHQCRATEANPKCRCIDGESKGQLSQ